MNKYLPQWQRAEQRRVGNVTSRSRQTLAVAGCAIMNPPPEVGIMEGESMIIDKDLPERCQS
jgi:hypothetical protein